jgi:hypothetical protein
MALNPVEESLQEQVRTLFGVLGLLLGHLRAKGAMSETEIVDLLRLAEGLVGDGMGRNDALHGLDVLALIARKTHAQPPPGPTGPGSPGGS